MIAAGLAIVIVAALFVAFLIVPQFTRMSQLKTELARADADIHGREGDAGGAAVGEGGRGADAVRADQARQPDA